MTKKTKLGQARRHQAEAAIKTKADIFISALLYGALERI